MKRFLLSILLMFGLMAPAHAVEMLLLPITTAVNPALSSTFQIRSGPGLSGTDMTIQANLTGASGGTSVDVYIQTSLDGGGTWTDVANFNFTTTPLRKVSSTSMASAVVAAATATDGSIASNTTLSGIFGNLWRVKVISVGTYTATTLRVDAIAVGLTSQ